MQASLAHGDNQSSPHTDGSKEKTSASSNLVKLKDLYGDSGDQKGDAGMERVPRRYNGGEEVIRLVVQLGNNEKWFKCCTLYQRCSLSLLRRIAPCVWTTWSPLPLFLPEEM